MKPDMTLQLLNQLPFDAFVDALGGVLNTLPGWPNVLLLCVRFIR
jgi:hypothetical protein